MLHKGSLNHAAVSVILFTFILAGMLVNCNGTRCSPAEEANRSGTIVANGHERIENTAVTKGDTRAADDGPVFSALYFTPATTGENMGFFVNVTDNGAVNAVYLNYSLDNGTFNHSVVQRTGDRWNITITAPTSELYFPYHFAARDDSGNWRRTTERFAHVFDNDRPEFEQDLTEGIPTTGDPYLIKITAEDNIEVTSIIIGYDFNLTGPQTEQMALHASGYWFLELGVPNQARILNYSFRLEDAAGNFINTNYTIEEVLDDNEPEFDPVEMDEPMTGHNLTVYAEVEDNRGIQSVAVLYTFNGTFSQEAMERLRGDMWAREISISSEASYMVYSFVMNDVSGNVLRSPDYNVTVADVIDPIASMRLPAKADQHELVEFNGSGSSDNIGIFNYTWSFTYDHSYKQYIGPNAAFRFHLAGIYEITLNVTDKAGNWNRLRRSLQIGDITPPAANAGSDEDVDQGEKFILYGGASSDNVGIADYSWGFNVTGEKKTLTGEAVYHTFYTPGKYDVTLTVTDFAGNSDTDVIVITVKDTTPPTAFAGDDITADENTMITFDASRSKDNVGIRNYHWRFQYGSAYKTLTGIKPTYWFGSPGTYMVDLTVTDMAGNDAKDSVQIRIRDITSPTVKVHMGGNALEMGKKYWIDSPLTLKLRANQSTDNVRISKFRWTFNHATGSQDEYGMNIEHRLESTGIYNVTLMVTDDSGNAGYLNFSLDVMEPTIPLPPKEQDDGGGALMGDQNFILLVLSIIFLLIMLIIAVLWLRRPIKVRERKVRVLRVKRHIYKRRAKPKRVERIDPEWIREYEMGLYEFTGIPLASLRGRRVSGGGEAEGAEEDVIESEMEEDDVELEMSGEVDIQIEEEMDYEDMLFGDARESGEPSVRELTSRNIEDGEAMVLADEEEYEMLVPDDDGIFQGDDEDEEEDIEYLFEGLDTAVDPEEIPEYAEDGHYGMLVPVEEDGRAGLVKSEKKGKDVVRALSSGQIRQVEGLLRKMDKNDVVQMVEAGLDIEKKPCTHCGALIDDFWAICPRCKIPL